MGRDATPSCGLCAGPGRGPGWGWGPAGLLWAEGALTPTLTAWPLPGPGPPRLQPGPFPGVPHSGIECPASRCVSESPACQEEAQRKGCGKHVTTFREPALRRVRRGEVRTQPLPHLSEPGAEAAQRAREAGGRDSGSRQGFRGGRPECRGLRKADPGSVRALQLLGAREAQPGSPHLDTSVLA